MSGGWYRTGKRAKFHWYRSLPGRSACGSVRLKYRKHFGKVRVLQPDYGSSPDDCKRCREITQYGIIRHLCK